MPSPLSSPACKDPYQERGCPEFKACFKANMSVSIFLLRSLSSPVTRASRRRLGLAVLVLHTPPERGEGDQKFSVFFPSDSAKLDGTGDRDYRSVLSQSSPKIKALKYSVIIGSLKEGFFFEGSRRSALTIRGTK